MVAQQREEASSAHYLLYGIPYIWSRGKFSRYIPHMPDTDLVQWSEKYIFTYIDTRLLQVLYTYFDQPFWDYGKFPLSDRNGTQLVNPWAGTGSNTSPFDQDFYLILSVAVGGTNGWFRDGKSGKPWLDSSPTAKRDFWLAKDQWYPTWQDRGWMEVKSVKMWQQAGHNGCK